MGQFKKPMIKQIQSIRSWLEKAEQSYEKESDMKGELQLMVARAEMAKLQENSSSSKWTYQWWIVMSLGLFISICVWMYTISSMSTTHKLIETENVTALEKKVEMQSIISFTPAEKNLFHTVNTQDKRDVLWTPKSERETVKFTSSVEREVQNEHNKTETIATSSDNNQLNTPQVGKQAGSEDNVLSTKDVEQAIRDGGRVLRGQ